MANLSVEEPDALMCARPDLWEPWAGNCPGPPGPERATTGVRTAAVLLPRALSGCRATDRGHALEWHLVLVKSFQDIAFDLIPGFHHSIVFLLPTFSQARFKPIGSIGNAMSCDGVEQLLEEAVAVR